MRSPKANSDFSYLMSGTKKKRGTRQPYRDPIPPYVVPPIKSKKQPTIKPR